MNNTELTIGNIYKTLHNVSSASEDWVAGCDLIKSYIKKETNLSEDKVEKVFNYCWEQGHSAGLYEVFSYAIELCELLKDVI